MTITAPTATTRRYGAVELVDAVSTVDSDGTVALFVVNRSNTADHQPVAAIPLGAADCEPEPGGTRMRATVPGISWTVFTLRPAAVQDGDHA